MHNSGRIGLEYSNEDLFLSNSIDINRNIILRIDKLLQQVNHIKILHTAMISFVLVKGEFNKSSIDKQKI